MNPLTSKLNKARTALCPGAQPNSPASPERRGGGTGAGWYTRLQAALNNKTAIRFAKYLIPITILLLFFLLLSLTSCKSPATLTNDPQHHTRYSNYHATVHRIETHDTIIIIGPYPKTPSFFPFKGEYSSLPLREGQGGSKSPFSGVPEKSLIFGVDFGRFRGSYTITLATLATIATLAFSIHLLLRYLKIRSPT